MGWLIGAVVLLVLHKPGLQTEQLARLAPTDHLAQVALRYANRSPSIDHLAELAKYEAYRQSHGQLTTASAIAQVKALT